MEVHIDQTKWYQRIWAAFIFFTRLPFWRVYQPPRECYKTVVEHWPLTGWLTGGAMAATLWFGAMLVPYPIAVIAAILVRLLLMGALHEDGLADFMDGFGGGGTDRQRILDIMKDSRIGTYGVLGLIVYEMLLFTTLFSLPPQMAALAILAADPYSKMVASQLIIMMPYARMLPMVGFLYLTGLSWQYILFLPGLVLYFLYLFIWHRLRGYTGDCCGAVCLLVELTVYLVVACLVTHPGA